VARKKSKTRRNMLEELLSKPKPKKSRKKKVLVGMGVGSIIGATLMKKPPK
jgi:hypothetical protein